MNTAIRCILFIVGSMYVTACNRQHQHTYDTELSVVIDRTDPLPVFPSAEDLTMPLNINDNFWNGYRVIITAISDKDLTDTFVFTLEKENEWNGNSIIRKTQVRRFVQRIAQCLNRLHNTTSYPRSIIYRTLARQCNQLSQSSASHKYLLVYSNLIENAEVNFYNPQTVALLRTNPKTVEMQLTQTQQVSALKGISIWLIYQPANYKENAYYMTIATFYRRLLESHNATVHIGNKFIVL